MKKVIHGIFGVLILSLGSAAFADGDWHPVLSCDDGAVTIDNQDTYSVGRGTFPATTAQVVIRNPQIVEYFSKALSMNNGSGDGYQIIDGQWISALFRDVTFPAGSVVTRFTIAGIRGSKVVVNYDGTELSVNAVNDNNQKADWRFHHCVRF